MTLAAFLTAILGLLTPGPTKNADGRSFVCLRHSNRLIPAKILGRLSTILVAGLYRP